MIHDVQASNTRAAPPEERDASSLDPVGDEGGALDSTGHAYGPPTTTARESNFISDDALLLWLADKENGLYGELRDHMDMSRTRSKLTEDLAHLKQEIDNDSLTREEAIQEIDELLEAYADTPFAGELGELLEPLRMNLVIAEGDATPMTTDLALKQLSDSIGNKIDALGRDDQLELIQIQSLTSDIREAGQLASNLMSSAAQTANAIVGNIRG